MLGSVRRKAKYWCKMGMTHSDRNWMLGGVQ